MKSGKKKRRTVQVMSDVDMPQNLFRPNFAVHIEGTVYSVQHSVDELGRSCTEIEVGLKSEWIENMRTVFNDLQNGSMRNNKVDLIFNNEDEYKNVFITHCEVSREAEVWSASALNHPTKVKITIQHVRL